MFIHESENEVVVVFTRGAKKWVSEKTNIKCFYDLFYFDGPLFKEGTNFKYQDCLFGDNWKKYSEGKNFRYIQDDLRLRNYCVHCSRGALKKSHSEGHA